MAQSQRSSSIMFSKCNLCRAKNAPSGAGCCNSPIWLSTSCKRATSLRHSSSHQGPTADGMSQLAEICFKGVSPSCGNDAPHQHDDIHGIPWIILCAQAAQARCSLCRTRCMATIEQVLEGSSPAVLLVHVESCKQAWLGMNRYPLQL